jgi:hypothetical protein
MVAAVIFPGWWEGMGAARSVAYVVVLVTLNIVVLRFLSISCFTKRGQIS